MAKELPNLQKLGFDNVCMATTSGILCEYEDVHRGFWCLDPASMLHSGNSFEPRYLLGPWVPGSITIYRSAPHFLCNAPKHLIFMKACCTPKPCQPVILSWCHYDSNIMILWPLFIHSHDFIKICYKCKITLILNEVFNWQSDAILSCAREKFSVLRFCFPDFHYPYIMNSRPPKDFRTQCCGYSPFWVPDTSFWYTYH